MQASGKKLAPDTQLRAAGNNTFVLSGTLTFESVPHVWKQSAAMFEKIPEVTLDMGNVSRSDSAGLALIVAWLRNARRQSATIRFRNVPEQLLAIAKTSRLEHLLVQE